MAAAAILAIFSCEKNPDNNGGGNDVDTPAGKENTPITLTADTATPEMTIETQLEDVLTLSWNATTNMGTGARIEYTVLMDLKGGSFENAYEVTAAGTSRAFTADELNTIIMEEFGCESGETVEMDMCVLATIKNDAVEDVISNTITVTLTAFTPKTTTLYLIGNATTANWDLAYAIAMNPIAGEDGGFSWSGDLLAGEIKFVVSNEHWVPSYGLGEEEGQLYLREKLFEDEAETIDTPDPKIRISAPGKYKITVNINNLTYTIVKTAGAVCNTMYLAGTSVDEPIEMFGTGYTFMKAAELKAGDLYFSENAAGNGINFWAASANQAPTSSAVALDGGNKWKVGADFYHITLYVKEGKEMADIVAADPYETLYLIGSATAAGWNLPSILPMTKKSAYVQEWEGPLNKGELKFTCDNQTDWMGAWYLASTGKKVPTGEVEPIIFLDKNNARTGQMGLKEFDQKWEITEAGTYKITLDQLAETIIIAKQ